MAMKRGTAIWFETPRDQCAVSEVAIEQTAHTFTWEVISDCDRPPVMDWMNVRVCALHHYQLMTHQEPQTITLPDASVRGQDE